MMEEITKYGNPTIKRIYGDWTKPHLSKWKNVLRRTEKRGIPWGTTWETVNGK